MARKPNSTAKANATKISKATVDNASRNAPALTPEQVQQREQAFSIFRDMGAGRMARG
jgi:hypothetical protein